IDGATPRAAPPATMLPPKTPALRRNALRVSASTSAAASWMAPSMSSCCRLRSGVSMDKPCSFVSGSRLRRPGYPWLRSRPATGCTGGASAVPAYRRRTEGAIGYADTMDHGEGHVVVPASVDIAGGLVVIASAVAVGIAGATTFTRAVAALGALFGFGMLALGAWQLQHENRVAAIRRRRSE